MTGRESSPFIPTVVTLVAVICWAGFMLLHIVFWSSSFDLFQNIAIIGLSIVVAACVIGLMWVSWLFRHD